ncbi:thioredoxin family protein [Polaribacter sp. KT 15]|uniref:thioredoxin family protein n=1 Tax=Polaribacter sp. KT 15 TaxID=1896175 RepID=UPI00090C36F1|nr:thioredoxin family protein [Polaribacter sp. KT 15]SHN01937.1 Thioredoxin-like [Polaribacter sp. KT 15]
MKKIFLLPFVILFTTIFFAQEDIDDLPLEDVVESKIEQPLPTANWESSYKEALNKSKKEKKPVLIYFTGSDWCGPCKVLDKKLFHSEKFKNIADKELILYEADNPRNKDLVEAKRLKETYDLIRKYHVKSYPTLVFVNHRGRMIGYKKGLILTEYYYPFINSVIENY